MRRIFPYFSNFNSFRRRKNEKRPHPSFYDRPLDACDVTDDVVKRQVPSALRGTPPSRLDQLNGKRPLSAGDHQNKKAFQCFGRLAESFRSDPPRMDIDLIRQRNASRPAGSCLILFFERTSWTSVGWRESLTKIHFSSPRSVAISSFNCKLTSPRGDFDIAILDLSGRLIYECFGQLFF